MCPYQPLEEEIAITVEQPVTTVTRDISACEPYRKIAEQYDWDVDTAIRIMFAESSCYPEALNDNPDTGDYSVGLMQINLYKDLKMERPPEDELLIPSENIKYAYELYSAQGFNPWTTY